MKRSTGFTVDDNGIAFKNGMRLFCDNGVWVDGAGVPQLSDEPCQMQLNRRHIDGRGDTSSTPTATCTTSTSKTSSTSYAHGVTSLTSIPTSLATWTASTYDSPTEATSIPGDLPMATSIGTAGHDSEWEPTSWCRYRWDGRGSWFVDIHVAQTDKNGVSQQGQNQEHCGQGFLDNMGGIGAASCTPRSWRCDYYDGFGYYMSFYIGIGCEWYYVQDTINKATLPHVESTCWRYGK